MTCCMFPIFPFFFFEKRDWESVIPKVNIKRSINTSTKTATLFSKAAASFVEKKPLVHRSGIHEKTTSPACTPQLTAVSPNPDWRTSSELIVEVLDLPSTEIQKKTAKKPNPLSIWPDFWQSFTSWMKRTCQWPLGILWLFCWFVSVFLPPSPAKKGRFVKSLWKAFSSKWRNFQKHVVNICRCETFSHVFEFMIRRSIDILHHPFKIGLFRYTIFVELPTQPWKNQPLNHGFTWCVR